MQKPLQLELETVTPIWTGGVHGTVDRLHETGLLGSLRWWYEALVRGVGGHVCNGGTCDPKKGLCDVCRVFGATGWRRRFRLTVENASKLKPERIGNMEADDPRKGKSGKQPKWFFKAEPLAGNVTLRIQSLDANFDPNIIAGLIQFLANWAAIGARPQMGFGVVKVQGDRVNMQPLYNHLCSLSGNETYDSLPSLANMFFTQIGVNSNRREETFNLKYDLRALALFRSNSKVRHFVMGTVQHERIAAKVKMSYPYTLDNQNVMRVWGWLPACTSNRDMSREDVINEIRGEIKRKYTVPEWREYNSPHDTVHPNQSDMPAFLHSLMQTSEPQP